jgi:hypothetical protein
LPNNTRLLGEGDSISSGTTIQAKASFSSADMIDLGRSFICDPLKNPFLACNTVSVENLILDGQGQAINGIVNSNAQSGTYLDHVSLYRILGTGLSVSGLANNSGPYTNITFNTGTSSANSSTTCVSINGVSTKGIQGLTCLSNGIPDAAVLLDASNNSLKDVSVDGFIDGLQVGENANAMSNVISNIHDPGNSSSMTNLVHICGANGSLGHGPCPNTNHTVTDLVIMGATAPPFNCPLGSACLDALTTIKDDVTGAFLTTAAGDNVVGMYVLGKSSSPSNGGYSRFTTSPNVPSWSVLTAGALGQCSPGSLLSNVNATASPVFYVCRPDGNGGGTWTGVK